jgi:hypothetical protein
MRVRNGAFAVRFLPHFSRQRLKLVRARSGYTDRKTVVKINTNTIEGYARFGRGIQASCLKNDQKWAQKLYLKVNNI